MLPARDARLRRRAPRRASCAASAARPARPSTTARPPGRARVVPARSPSTITASTGCGASAPAASHRRRRPSRVVDASTTVCCSDSPDSTRAISSSTAVPDRSGGARRVQASRGGRRSRCCRCSRPARVATTFSSVRVPIAVLPSNTSVVDLKLCSAQLAGDSGGERVVADRAGLPVRVLGRKPVHRRVRVLAVVRVGREGRPHRPLLVAQRERRARSRRARPAATPCGRSAGRASCGRLDAAPGHYA